MTHFYLTLPSNSSHQFYPNNTMTDFTTKLASTVELTNEWEVGLAEIMFPRSWCTIPKRGLSIIVDCSNCTNKPAMRCPPADPRQRYLVTMHVNGGFYHSMDEFIIQLNSAAYRAFLPPGGHDERVRTTAPHFYYSH